MTQNPILSIFIAIYNRKDVLVKKLKDILGIDSNQFDVFVLDDGSDDETMEALGRFHDKRLHFEQNLERQGLKENGVMQNFHLNDRDLLDIHGLQELIGSLKEHTTLTGGICNIRGGYSSVCIALLKRSWQYRILVPIQLALS